MSPPEAKSILLVDDDDNLRRVVEYQLSEEGFEVIAVPSGSRALETLRGRRFDVVVTDILMPGLDGIQLLERVRIQYPSAAVIVITAHGDVARAVRAMQMGALDFLEKPFTRERLVVAVRRAIEFAGLRYENRRLRAMIQEHESFEEIVGSSAALRSALSDLRLAAESDATVLILGESGTGKELAARALHRSSKRREGPFIVVNCGSIPENLVESELFGHCKGAFTGAVADRRGRFELADGGTVFLDEVGELPLPLQPKLLRVLQEAEIDKLGVEKPIRVDVRVVAASHRELDVLVREAAFREDLWYRLAVVPLRMPPLRERKGDIPVLAEHFLVKHVRRHGRPLPKIEPAVFDRLERYDWPGNVRELENVIERLVVLTRSDTVGVNDLPEPLRLDLPRYGGVRIEIPPEGCVLEEVERGLIEEALNRCGGNQSAAARFLGISRQTLLYRVRKFGLL